MAGEVRGQRGKGGSGGTLESNRTCQNLDLLRGAGASCECWLDWAYWADLAGRCRRCLLALGGDNTSSTRSPYRPQPPPHHTNPPAKPKVNKSPDLNSPLRSGASVPSDRACDEQKCNTQLRSDCASANASGVCACVQCCRGIESTLRDARVVHAWLILLLLLTLRGQGRPESGLESQASADCHDGWQLKRLEYD